MEYSYKGHTVSLDQPGIYCDTCEESLLLPEDIDATRIDLMEFQAKVDRILGPKGVKAIRKALRKTQRDLSKDFRRGA